MHYDTVGYVDTRFKCQYYWGITMVQRHIYLIMIAEFLTSRICLLSSEMLSNETINCFKTMSVKFGEVKSYYNDG